MKINLTHAADPAATPERERPASSRAPGVRVITPAARLAATAAGAALAGSTVNLAFFLARKPTVSFGRHHAKFRA